MLRLLRPSTGSVKIYGFLMLAFRNTLGVSLGKAELKNGGVIRSKHVTSTGATNKWFVGSFKPSARHAG
jgi:hypothetical protein